MKTLQSRKNEIIACPIIIREAHVNIGIIGRMLYQSICMRVFVDVYVKRFIVIHRCETYTSFNHIV